MNTGTNMRKLRKFIKDFLMSIVVVIYPLEWQEEDALNLMSKIVERKKSIDILEEMLEGMPEKIKKHTVN
jgi:hypothetical protein